MRWHGPTEGPGLGVGEGGRKPKARGAVTAFSPEYRTTTTRANLGKPVMLARGNTHQPQHRQGGLLEPAYSAILAQRYSKPQRPSCLRAG